MQRERPSDYLFVELVHRGMVTMHSSARCSQHSTRIQGYMDSCAPQYVNICHLATLQSTHPPTLQPAPSTCRSHHLRVLVTPKARGTLDLCHKLSSAQFDRYDWSVMMPGSGWAQRAPRTAFVLLCAWSPSALLSSVRWRWHDSATPFGADGADTSS